MLKYFACCSRQVGMRHFNIRKNQYFQPIINLDKLWSLLGNEVRRPARSRAAAQWLLPNGCCHLGQMIHCMPAE